MKTNSRSRSFIDFLRGIAIFLMLWGHSVQYCCGGQFDFFENSVFKLIYSFHMPFFMLISGYLFFFSEQKRGLTELIEYKTKSLLYPILMCSVLNILLTSSIEKTIEGGVKGYIELFGSTPITSLWFLWSVIAGSIALGFAIKITKNKVLQGILILAGVGCAAILPCWDMNVYMYPYFAIGYLYSRNRDRLVKYFNVSGLVSLIAFIIMLSFFEKKHYIYTSGLLGGENIIDSLKIDFFRWAIGLFGSVAVIWICKFVHGRMNGKVKVFIESHGKDSLAVYALSVSLLSFWLPRIANAILSRITINWNSCIWLYNLVVTPLVALLYAVLLLWIIKLMKKYKVYRLVFGR